MFLIVGLRLDGQGYWKNKIDFLLGEIDLERDSCELPPSSESAKGKT